MPVDVYVKVFSDQMGFRNPNLKIFEKLGGCKKSLINRFWLESEGVGHVNRHSKGYFESSANFGADI